jgi:hypothetical protein
MRRLALILAVLIALPAAGQTTKPSSRPGGEIVPPPRRDVPGKRIALSRGELFVPDFFHTGGQADVVIWFLGASWCAEQVFYDAHKNAVLLVTNAKTLGQGFPRPDDFNDLLEEVGGALNTADITDGGIGRVALVSFSGGWTGVYGVLAHPNLARAIDNVILLDSLYARDKASGKIDEKAIGPFVDFARRASKGETVFVFTQLYPPEEQYRSNTTSVCASYLIDQLRLDRKPATGTNAAGAKLLYRAEQGNAHILGYAGMTNQDHFNHFYGAADALKMMSLPSAK